MALLTKLHCQVSVEKALHLAEDLIQHEDLLRQVESRTNRDTLIDNCNGVGRPTSAVTCPLCSEAPITIAFRHLSSISFQQMFPGCFCRVSTKRLHPLPAQGSYKCCTETYSVFSYFKGGKPQASAAFASNQLGVSPANHSRARIALCTGLGPGEAGRSSGQTTPKALYLTSSNTSLSTAKYQPPCFPLVLDIVLMNLDLSSFTSDQVYTCRSGGATTLSHFSTTPSRLEIVVQSAHHGSTDSGYLSL